MLKTLSFAQPTSPNAHFFGHADTGCFLVTRDIPADSANDYFNERKVGRTRAAATATEALSLFDAIDQETHRFSMRLDEESRADLVNVHG